MTDFETCLHGVMSHVADLFAIAAEIITGTSLRSL